MKPVIALVGRPNVGKSTLFNRLTKSRDALVANIPGLTRDRQYGEGRFDDHRFIVIDTGGIGEEEGGVDTYMASQSFRAIEEADIICFMVDARAGAIPGDASIANQLRSYDEKKIFLVANKIDGVDADVALADFYSFGLGEPIPVAASQSRGISNLMETILSECEADFDDEAEDKSRGIKIAAVGRPNVGKSTLVNRMLGEERVVVYDMPGTTRDSIYSPYERRGKDYTLIDTAGVRRRGKVNETVEKFSVIKALQAIQDAHVVILVLDAREGIVDQDLHLLGFVLEAGRALVIAVNKWDGMEPNEKNAVKRELQRRLNFINFAKIHFISALHGTAVGDLYGSIEKAHKSAEIEMTTSELTRILENAVNAHALPLSRGRRIKLRYAHQGGSHPPTVVIHGNQTDNVPDSYKRYLENTFREALRLEGTPIRIEFKTGRNPYAGRRNILTPRQLAKKRRMMEHVRKTDKKKKNKKK